MKMRLSLVFMIIILLILTTRYALAYGDQKGDYSAVSAEDSVVHDVFIRSHSFSANELLVNLGDSVVWTNEDSDTHDIDSNFRGLQRIGPGMSYSFTFDKAGTYFYESTDGSSMRGIVYVK